MLDRVLNLIGVARISLVKDDKDVQRVQLSQGSTGSDKSESLTDDVAMVTHFGFSSNAPLKAETVVVRIGGNRSQTIAIGSSHRPSRPTGLKPGEVKLYNQRGAYVFLGADAIIIDAGGKPVTVQNADVVTVKASTKVRLETPKVEVTGDVVSRCDGTPVSLNALRDAFHAHKHTGVQTGGGSTGPTDHDA